MVLKLFEEKADYCNYEENVIALYGGNFDFEYNVAESKIIITTQRETKTYPCYYVDVDADENVVYACTEKMKEEKPEGDSEKRNDPLFEVPEFAFGI